MKVKNIALIMSLLMAGSALSGCGSKQTAKEGQTVITIGNWSQDDTEASKVKMKQKEAFEKANPDIVIQPDAWGYDVSSFLPKASSNQLPTGYSSWFTEVNKISNQGFAADITEAMQKFGFADAMQEQVKSAVTVDGKYYALPTDAYVMGLYINMNLFEEAGLVNEDGTPKIPQTYDELAETAKIIKDKTGKAGFVMPTMNNQGGWHFLNIAYAFGVDFLEKEDGKWVTKMDSEEMVNALTYLKDLKWKYNVLPENALVDGPELIKLFATDQVAMVFNEPGYFNEQIVTAYKMDKNKVAMGSIPEGPAGRYSLFGGNIIMFSPSATEAEIDAAVKWYEYTGIAVNLNDEISANLEDTMKAKETDGKIIGDVYFNVYPNSEKSKYEKELYEKYTNVNMDMFKEYTDFSRVTIKPEVEVNCQELYSLLDSCIQKVLTEENSNVEEIVKQTAETYQKNYLDKAE